MSHFPKASVISGTPTKSQGAPRQQPGSRAALHTQGPWHPQCPGHPTLENRRQPPNPAGAGGQLPWCQTRWLPSNDPPFSFLPLHPPPRTAVTKMLITKKLSSSTGSPTMSVVAVPGPLKASSHFTTKLPKNKTLYAAPLKPPVAHS